MGYNVCVPQFYNCYSAQSSLKGINTEKTCINYYYTTNKCNYNQYVSGSNCDLL